MPWTAMTNPSTRKPINKIQFQCMAETETFSITLQVSMHLFLPKYILQQDVGSLFFRSKECISIIISLVYALAVVVYNTGYPALQSSHC
jgi:hypothetical protein